MSLVLDASVALAWVLGEPDTDIVVRARVAVLAEPPHVPCNWPLEMVNALVMAGRSGRITAEEVASSLRAVKSFPLKLDTPDISVACGGIAHVATAHELTAYDAAYLELAMRHGAMLVTQDRELCEAAEAMRVQFL